MTEQERELDLLVGDLQVENVRLQALLTKLQQLVTERRPLPDHEVDALWDEPHLTTPQRLARRALTRLVEKAHGIGVQL